MTNAAETPAAPTAAPAPPKPASEAARRFAVDAARLAAYTRCVNVVVLDVSRVSPVTDFFVLATGSSGRQMRAVANQVEDLGREQSFKPLGRHGHDGESWVLTDFVDVIVHVFSPDARGYYDLDGLWGDAPVVDWQTGAPPPPNRPAVDFDAADDGFAVRPATAMTVDDEDDDFDEDDDDFEGDEEDDDEGDVDEDGDDGDEPASHR